MKKFYSKLSDFITILLICGLISIFSINLTRYMDYGILEIIEAILIYISIACTIIIALGIIPGGFISRRKDRQKKINKELKERIETLENDRKV
ncbi:MAG: hypothetical protein PHV79_00190 [Clostridia bacterium]|jgi:hypothetical protein|nr:hypothetical protein [Clostridia bacterium]